MPLLVIAYCGCAVIGSCAVRVVYASRNILLAIIITTVNHIWFYILIGDYGSGEQVVSIYTLNLLGITVCTDCLVNSYLFKGLRGKCHCFNLMLICR